MFQSFLNEDKLDSMKANTMTSAKDNRERRRHERFLMNDKVFLTFRPHFDRIGPITDISKGGVALEYAVIQEYAELSDAICVDIFSSSKKFEMFNVPCRLIYDRPMKEKIGFLETIETRRCGLKFEQLTPLQVERLDKALGACKIMNHEKECLKEYH